MSDPIPKRALDAILDHWAAALAIAVAGFASVLWTRHAQVIYDVMFAAFGGRGVLALVMILGVALVYLWATLVRQKSKAKTIFERIVPVPKAGYCVDPKTGEYVCPRCAAENRPAYLAHVDDHALYCQSCGHGVKRFPEYEAKPSASR